ncbi:MAG TPA: hypothetical protein DCM36_08800 [Xanthomonadaceae bacterium]|nr:hypothetical protein [Xanthomonadaceae bacterium]
MSASLAGGAAADMAPRPAALRFTPSFYLWHLLPLALLLFALVVAMNGLDQWLADAVFRWEGMQWALRDSPLTRHVIHQLGKRFSTLLWLGFAIALALTWRKPDWRPLRRPLAYVLLAVAISTITVTVIKSLTHMDCPWDLVRYGGGKPFIGLFEARPAGMGKATACFPAGHASGGYAWLSLYFFLCSIKPRWRWAGLAFGLGLGLLFGISQQLRGAHFVSHDIATLMCCWFVALSLHWWMLRDRAALPGTHPLPAAT